jgi:diguanylate cyclase (GGDEF)-like protein/PAS domain S-box-containing protein
MQGVADVKWPDLRRLEGYLPQDVEEAYRRHYLKDYVRTASISMLLLSILLVVFAFNDYKLFGLTPVFYFLIALRSVYLIYFIFLVIYLRKNTDPRKYDINLFVWLIFSMMLVLVINLTRPAGYEGNFIIDVILILLVYLCMPTRLLFQIMGASLFTVGEIVIFFLIRQIPSSIAAYTAVISMMAANIGGIFAASIIYTFRRNDYKSRMEIQQVTDEWKTTFNSISDLISIQDADCRLVRVNQAYADMFGQEPESLAGKHCYEIVHGTTAPIDHCPHMQTLKTRETITEEIYEPRLGAYLEITTSPIIKDGVLTGTVHLVKNISERKRIEHELLNNQRILSEMGSLAKAGGWELDVLTGKQIWTEELYRILEVGDNFVPTEEEVIKFYPEDARAVITKAIRRAIIYGEPFDVELALITAKGNQRWVHTIGKAHRENGRTLKVGGMFQDITERKQLLQKLEETSTHDFLTGLPNRLLLKDRFDMAMARAKRRKGKMALLSLDMDRLKLINDSLGHSVGDEVLKAFALRLQEVIRLSDTVARMGGDEFMILLQEIHVPEDAATVAQKILERFKEPIEVDGQSLRVTTSIGIAFYPDHGTDLEDLGKKSDEALYQAKGQGRNNYQLYK